MISKGFVQLSYDDAITIAIHTYITDNNLRQILLISTFRLASLCAACMALLAPAALAQKLSAQEQAFSVMGKNSRAIFSADNAESATIQTIGDERWDQVIRAFANSSLKIRASMNRFGQKLDSSGYPISTKAGCLATLHNYAEASAILKSADAALVTTSIEMREAIKERGDAINTLTALSEDSELREVLASSNESLKAGESQYEQSWRRLIDAERELVEFAKQHEGKIRLTENTSEADNNGDAAAGYRLFERVLAANKAVNENMAILMFGLTAF